MRLRPTIEDYIQYHDTEGTRRKTRVKYRGILIRFCDYAEGQSVYFVGSVNMSLFDKYRAHRKPVLSAKSMHHEGATIKSFLSWCADRDLIGENPLAKRKFTPPRLEPRGGPSLSEVNRILAAASEVRHPVFATLAFSGVRSGECQRFQVDDVDLDGNWLHVVSRHGLETKTGRSRKVPIHPRLRKVLAAIPRSHRPWFFTALPSPRYPDGLHHINTKLLNEELLKVLRKLGIRAGREGGYTVHSFRHFFRTHAVNSGVPERVIDIWLGHASDKSMGSVYYALSDEESQKFMERISFDEES